MVNQHTVFPIAGGGWKEWDQFDIIFFFRHNNMITPPPNSNNPYRLYFWSKTNSGSWEELWALDKLEILNTVCGYFEGHI